MICVSDLYWNCEEINIRIWMIYVFLFSDIIFSFDLKFIMVFENIWIKYCFIFIYINKCFINYNVEWLLGWVDCLFLIIILFIIDYLLKNGI